MVRKRSRTSRKYYESDDNDSDSDFSLEDPRSQPAPKKYSLRQRKKALFIDDYDYEDDDEILPIPPTKAHSDDEDFEVERELAVGEVVAPDGEYVVNSTYANNYEDPAEDPNGLIDFEDMIRADIVVNKNRIDYDNMIDKTEITIKPNDTPAPVRSKRGRKPKKRPENEVDSSVLEPDMDVQETEDKNDRDYNPEEELETEKEKQQNCIQKEKQQNCIQNDPVKKNVEADCSLDADTLNSKINEDKDAQISHISTPEVLNDDSSNKNSDNIHTNSQESVIKLNENYLPKSVQLNGTVLTAEASEITELKEDPLVNSLENEEEDDDVVFIEDKRSEIIVLDD